MNRKKFLAIICPLVLIIVICTALFIGLKRPAGTQISYKDELRKSFINLTSSILTDSASEYSGTGKYLSSITSGSTDIKLTTVINDLAGYDEITGSQAQLLFKKEQSSKLALADLNASYRGIPILSSKVSIKDSTLKVMIPKLYKGIITAETSNLSKRIQSSILAMFVPDNKYLSLLDNLNYNSIFNTSCSDLLTDAITLLANEFTSLYPEDCKTISDNITVDKNSDSYVLHINKTAMKLFVSDFGDFLFDSPILKEAMDIYLSQLYLSDAHISDYFSAEEYKKQYISSLRESVTSGTDVAADLINFDIVIKFELDKDNSIRKITYSDGNGELSVDLVFKFTPCKSSTNVDGKISLNILDDTYNFSITRNLVPHKADINDSINLFLSGNDSEILNLSYNMNYSGNDTISRTLTLSPGQNTFKATSSTKFTSLSSGGIACNNQLFLGLNDSNILSLTSDINVAPLRDTISELSGKEYDIFNMKPSELYSLGTEISNNYNTLKGQIN